MAERPDAILLFGIAPRSGTNYLYDLLRLHPEVGICPPYWEDFLTAHADLLDTYTRDVAARWRALEPVWSGDIPADVETRLLGSLGDGLLGFLRARSDRHLILSKTPSTENLDLAPRLFPRAAIVVLVRDGRAVVESAVRSGFGLQHGNRYDVFTRNWSRGAQSIINFERLHDAAAVRVHRVRYEDVIADLDGSMHALFGFLGLATDPYDFGRARSLPVRGSSTFGREHDVDGDRVSWEPRAKTADFRPLDRWADWPRSRHAMFNRIAGEAMRRLGYELEDTTTASG